MSVKPKHKSNPSKTVLVIATGFAVIFFLTKASWTLYVSIVIGLLGISSEFVAAKIEWLWLKLAGILSKIVPNIVLSIVFYVFLTPMAWLSRIFGEKNPLHLKNTDSSLFKVRNKKFEPVDFENPW